MSPQTLDCIESFIAGKIELPQDLAALKLTYENAKPFKHLVIDNMLPNRMIEELVDEMPALNSGNWVAHDDEHLIKYNMRSVVQLGDHGTQLTAFLHSARFLYFLSELTGIWELLPDPYLQGSGFHLLPKGGKFDVHVDRNTAYETGLIRRLAMIIYLNKDWKTEYGGQLQLWNADATKCEASIEPLFNRTVLFEITDRNYHGINGIYCPTGRSRNSFALYYHTAASNMGKEIAPHTSIYAPGSGNEGKFSLRSIVRDITPPILWRGLKSFRQAK
jgi:hypothetical protein